MGSVVVILDATSGMAASSEARFDVGRVVFRAIIERMSRDEPEDSDWSGFLDAAYGIRYLNVATAREKYGFEYASSLRATVDDLLESGPPDYYPSSDIGLFYDDLRKLRKALEG